MKELQNKVKKFIKNNKLETSAENRFLDLVSEIGEVGKEILKMSNYGKEEPTFRNEIKGELGDTLFSLICLAEKYDINLEDELMNVLAKYEKRLKKGGAGSENE